MGIISNGSLNAKFGENLSAYCLKINPLLKVLQVNTQQNPISSRDAEPFYWCRRKKKKKGAGIFMACRSLPFLNSISD